MSDDNHLTATVKAVAYDATGVHQWLNKFLRDSHLGKSGYAVKDRLKSWESIQAKVQRKKQNDPEYSPATLTDASGIRLVTLFQSDLPETLNKFIGLIDTVEPGSDGGFEDDPIDHVLIYSSRRDNDPLSIEKEAIKVLEGRGLKDKLRPPDPRPSSYSSIHLILNVWANFNKSIVRSKVELQLRSVFEDAWGEINHLLDYAPKKEALGIVGSSNGVVPENAVPEVWSQHLNALKALADGCAQYADVIRRQYLLAQDDDAGIEVAQRNPQPADRTDETAALFINCSNLVRDAVNTALNARDEAQKVPRTEISERARAFRNAAEAFAFARSTLDSNAPAAGPDCRALDHTLRAHLAYCLMFTGNEELVNKAEQILRELLDEDKNDAVPCYRLGQILEDTKKYEEARQLFEEGVRRLGRTNLAPDHWLRSSLPRGLGYIVWNLARTEADDEKRRGLLEAALSSTGDALHAARTEPHQDMARNNFIYYALDLMPLVKDQSGLMSAVKEHFAVLNDRADLEHDDMERLDTLMRAAFHIGEIRRAKDVAEQLMERFDAKIFGNGSKDAWREKIPSERDLARLTPAERDVYHFAQRVLLAEFGRF